MWTSRQSFSFHKNLFIPKRNSSSPKFFSSLSPVHSKPTRNYDTNFFFKKANKPKQIQCRYFSLNNVNSVFESIRHSEAAKLVNDALIAAHDISGLSWSGTIIASCLAMKLFVSLPCGIYQHYLGIKLEFTTIELREAVKKLRETIVKKATRGQWTNEKFQKELRREEIRLWKALVVKNNCHPFKVIILSLAQLPFWVLLTVTIRSLALDSQSKEMENPLAALQFRVGGPFWCPNLAVPDPTFVLPIINFLSMLTVIELSQASRIPNQMNNRVTTFLATKVVPNFLRVFAVFFFLVSSVSPAGVSLFWASNSIISLGQNLMLMSPRMRRVLKFPKPPSEVDKPYSYAYNNFCTKIQGVFLKK